MRRSLGDLLENHPKNKIVLLTGPRQVGKTTLSQAFFKDHTYLNWDNLDHRKMILDRAWARSKPYVILDEIHKMPQWKGWLKGIYDLEHHRQQYVVTGSARLNTYRKMGDSLAGRFFSYTLHPFDLKEIIRYDKEAAPQEIITNLLERGGFPEPYLSNSESFYRQWRKSHLDIIIRQDLINLQTIQEIGKIDLLIESLKASVGSTISYNSISEDLHVHNETVKNWVKLLEELFLIYRITPFSKNIRRAIQKSPKVYFFDIPQAKASGDGGVFENLIANSLLKTISLKNEAGLGEYELHFLRNRDGKEVDFLITKDNQAKLMIEAKLSEDSPSPSFKVFSKFLPEVPAVQVVYDLKQEKDYPFGLKILKAENFLLEIEDYL